MIAIAKCGIEKYDELPGRVGIIDVDGHRAALKHLRNDRLRDKLIQLWLPVFYHRLSTDAIERKIIDELEEAQRIHTGELEPSWTRLRDMLVSKFRNTSTKGDT